MIPAIEDTIPFDGDDMICTFITETIEDGTVNTLGYELKEKDTNSLVTRVLFVDEEGNAIPVKVLSNEILILQDLENDSLQLTVCLADKPEDNVVRQLTVQKLESTPDVVLGDENQLNELIAAFSDTTDEELLDSVLNDELTEEEAKEADLKTEEIFKVASSIDQLTFDRNNIFEPGQIELLQEASDNMVAQMAAGKKAFNKELLAAQLPPSQRQLLQRDFNAKYKPMEDQVKIVAELIPKLLEMRETFLKVSAKKEDAP